MLLVGLTGGIGAGKSTVARMLGERGAVVIDADLIAREVVEPGTPGFERVVERFGVEVLAPDGSIDRGRLAALVFADEEARADLNAIVHPLVGEEVARRVAAAPPDAIVVLDVPLLAESTRRGYDCVVVVEAPSDVRLDRLEARGVVRDDAEARMRAQATDEERRAVADLVVDNSGDRAALRQRVDELWAELERRRQEKERREAPPHPFSTR